MAQQRIPARRARLLATLRLQYPDALADSGFRLLHPETGERYTDDRRHLVATRRSIANFALGAAADCPEWCFDAAEHGLTFLREAHRAANGYHLVVDSGGEPLNQTRSAYGHAFALLAYAHDNHGSEDEIRPDTPFTTLLQFGAIAVAVIGSVAVVLESTFFSRRKDQK